MASFELTLIRGTTYALDATSPYMCAKFAQWLYTFTPRRTRKPSPKQQKFLTSGQPVQIPYPKHALRGWWWGSPDAPIILLVHGWGDSPLVFTDMAERFVASGYRVFGYEAPAHGPHPERRSSPMKFADAVRAALEVTGDVDSIIAHSVGAGGVIIAAKKGLPTKRIALVCPLTSVIKHTDAFAKYVGCSLKSIARMRAFAWEYSEPSSSFYASDWESLFESPEPCPTLIVHDQNDKVVPPDHGEWLLQQWPGSRLVKTQGLGHRRVLRDPAVIDKVLQFIRNKEPVKGASDAATV